MKTSVLAGRLACIPQRVDVLALWIAGLAFGVSAMYTGVAGALFVLARLARDRGQRSICVASDLLASEESASADASETPDR